MGLFCPLPVRHSASPPRYIQYRVRGALYIHRSQTHILLAMHSLRCNIKDGPIFWHSKVWLKGYCGCKAAPKNTAALQWLHWRNHIWQNSQKQDQIVWEAPWNWVNLTFTCEIGYVTAMTDQFPPLCVFLRRLSLSRGPPVQWTVVTFIFCKPRWISPFLLSLFVQ